MDFISNAQIPGKGGIPKVVIFLTADAFGVLPPISRLSHKAAMYHFVTGFTSKLAGTERGVTEPVPTFSTLFGEPFMPLDASVYAEMLGDKLDKYGTNFPDATFRAYLSTTFGFTEGMTLTSVQLNRVSAVDVRSKNITSLKEIEYFKNLQMYIMAVIYIIKF